MSRVKISDWTISCDNIDVVELCCSLGKEGPDPVNEQIEMEMEVRHCGPTCFHTLVPVSVDCELVNRR